MGEMKINISDNLADQRTKAKRVVEMWITGELATPHDAARAVATALVDERRRALEEVAALIIDTHRMGDRDAWLDLARLIRAKAHAGQEG